MTASPYSSAIDSSVLEGMLGAPPRLSSFAELVSRLEGRHPSEILSELEVRPASNDDIGTITAEMIRDARERAPGARLPQGEGLALPHPLDAEWRFTEAVAEMLLHLAVSETRDRDPILLMGVPSVVLAAARSCFDRQFWTLGEPNVITETLNISTREDRRFLQGTPNASSVAAAILDPPWYVNQYSSMLGEAAGYCRPGACILISSPPGGARPNIASDLKQIRRAAATAGLRVLTEEKGALRYRTPFFEMAAMRAAGVGAWLPDWRAGDLLHYVRTRPAVVGPSTPVPTAFELTLAGIRLRLLPRPSGAGMRLIPIWTGEVFPSVSARAPRRSDANLWTSGNRAFAIDPTIALIAMATIASDQGLWPKRLNPQKRMAANFRQIDATRQVIYELTELAKREFTEAESLVGAESWGSSVHDARFLSGSWDAFHASPLGIDE